MRIEHVALYVTHLEKTKDFFITYFEAQSNEGYYNPKTGFRSYFLTFKEGARLEIMNQIDVKEKNKALSETGYSHIAFSVGSKEKVNELTSRLKEDGYQVESGPRTTGDGYYESCILDLEGNQIEITI